jgi:SNF family Na+-dependent transporter
VLIIQSATLPGAADGIKFYIIPRWELVAKFEVDRRRAVDARDTERLDASVDSFSDSLGLSFGSLMAYSASNKFNNNFFR